MSLCPCGNSAEEDSALCSRCTSLQILELQPGATTDEIKAAYHMLVKVWHPDRFQADSKLRSAAEEKLKAINSAYVALTTPQKANSRPRRPRAASQTPPSESASTPPPDEPVYRAPRPTAVPRRGPSLRAYFATFAALTVVQRLLVVACGLALGGATLKIIDSELASDPGTSAVYSEYRSAMLKQLDAPRQRMWDMIEQTLHRFSQHPATAELQSAAISTPTPDAPASPTASHAGSTSSSTKVTQAHLTAFITEGLTKDEVIAIAGTPASSSDDKLVFTGAEIDFKDGQVCGWKVDPAVSSLHVKLWPGPEVDHTLRVFSVDSTKDDVLVVQGTPTTLTSDKFAYGNSEIYFRNNRVVSWKNDPASAPLRAVSR
jgi:hypothetical protein